MKRGREMLTKLSQKLELPLDIVSGDVAHHEFLGASACGVTLVAAGHFETENPVVKTIFDYLEKTVTDVDFFVISQQSPTHFI